MPAIGLLINFSRDSGVILEPRRPFRTLMRHDTKITARAKFLGTDGVGLNLTGVTIRYSLRDLASDTLVVNRQAATAENQTTNLGECFYTFAAPQVAHALEGLEEWEIEWSAGVAETFPVGLRQRVRIVGDVDNA